MSKVHLLDAAKAAVGLDMPDRRPEVTRDECLTALRHALVEVLAVDPEEVQENARLRADLDADSLDLMELATILEDRLGISFPDDALASINTVGDALKVVLDNEIVSTNE
jgi:acyl carrier protein